LWIFFGILFRTLGGALFLYFLVCLRNQVDFWLLFCGEFVVECVGNMVIWEALKNAQKNVPDFWVYFWVGIGAVDV
jgi:hypothetical protein